MLRRNKSLSAPVNSNLRSLALLPGMESGSNGKFSYIVLIFQKSKCNGYIRILNLRRIIYTNNFNVKFICLVSESITSQGFPGNGICAF